MVTCLCSSALLRIPFPWFCVGGKAAIPGYEGIPQNQQAAGSHLPSGDSQGLQFLCSGIDRLCKLVLGHYARALRSINRISRGMSRLRETGDRKTRHLATTSNPLMTCFIRSGKSRT